MDRNEYEPAQYAWSSVRDLGVSCKKPQYRTWEFYMKPGNTLRTIESSQGGSTHLIELGDIVDANIQTTTPAISPRWT